MTYRYWLVVDTGAATGTKIVRILIVEGERVVCLKYLSSFGISRWLRPLAFTRISEWTASNTDYAYYVDTAVEIPREKALCLLRTVFK